MFIDVLDFQLLGVLLEIADRISHVMEELIWLEVAHELWVYCHVFVLPGFVEPLIKLLVNHLVVENTRFVKSIEVSLHLFNVG